MSENEYELGNPDLWILTIVFEYYLKIVLVGIVFVLAVFVVFRPSELSEFLFLAISTVLFLLFCLRLNVETSIVAIGVSQHDVKIYSHEASWNAPTGKKDIQVFSRENIIDLKHICEASGESIIHEIIILYKTNEEKCANLIVPLSSLFMLCTCSKAKRFLESARRVLSLSK